MDSKMSFNASIIQNIKQIKSELGNSSDLMVRPFNIKVKKNNLKLAVLFICGLVDKDKINSLSLELNKLIISEIFDNPNDLEDCFNKLKTSILCDSKVMEGSDYETLYTKILSGQTIILMDGYEKFLTLNTYGPQGRSITEPTSQTIIRGPKEAFTEKIEVNISMIRRKIKDKSMKIENMSLGSITKTNIAIVYLDGIAKQEIVNEVKSRLHKLKVDAILEGGYIEELTKDNPYSMFPTFLNSEKPDSVAGGLLEGKIAILVDGTPYVLTVPALFVDFLQVSEDYYHHFLISSMTRIFRVISFFLTLLVPAIYIALTTFHHEMIPTPLLISIAAQREGVPFPAFVECALMELTFEVLREAGVRMPRAVGSAISIVGALVLGQAAVQAGIISAAIVITVSITAISSFAIPNYSMSNAIRALRFILMVLSAVFGLYGIYIGLIVLALHLSSLKSFGVPYLTPLAPKVPKEGKDTFLRLPLWTMRYRPSEVSKTKAPRIFMRHPVKPETAEDQELK